MGALEAPVALLEALLAERDGGVVGLLVEREGERKMKRERGREKEVDDEREKEEVEFSRLAPLMAIRVPPLSPSPLSLFYSSARADR